MLIFRDSKAGKALVFLLVLSGLIATGLTGLLVWAVYKLF